MASPITFSGLASGLDTKGIIDALVTAAKQPITLLQNKKDDDSTKSSLLTNLSTMLSSLSTQAKSMDTLTEMRSLSAKVSDDTVLSATASGTAQAGSYSLTVKALAQAERTYSYTVSDEAGKNLVGAGNLTINDGTTSKTIAIDQTNDTLDTVAQQINSAGLNVTASIVKDGTTSRLLVAGKLTGDKNGITFTETGTLATKLGLSDAASQAQAAQSAWVVMDKLDFHSDTNQADSVVPGVTLGLNNLTATDQPVTVTVSPNLSDVTTKLQGLVTAYNKVATFIHSQSTYSGTVQTNTLIGDSTLDAVKRSLQTVIGTQVTAGGAIYDRLANIGVTTQKDGTLTLDTTKLQTALGKDFEGVMKLLAYDDGTTKTDKDGVMQQMSAAVDSLLKDPDGAIPAEQAGLTRAMSALDSEMATKQTNLDKYQQTLQAQYSALETLLSSFQSQGSLLTQTFSTSTSK